MRERETDSVTANQEEGLGIEGFGLDSLDYELNDGFLSWEVILKIWLRVEEASSPE